MAIVGCEASVLCAIRVRARVGILMICSGQSLVHILYTIDQPSCRRLVRVGRLRSALASLERWGTGLMVRNIALTGVWKKWQDSGDLLMVNSVRLTQDRDDGSGEYTPFALKPISQQKCK